MRKFASYVLAALLFLPGIASAQGRAIKPYQTPPLQTPTPLGFGTVLCVADGVSGASLGSTGTIVLGQVTITSSGFTSAPAGLLAIDVNITNGTLTSQYVVTFVDNDASATLNCGDTIVSIIPAS